MENYEYKIGGKYPLPTTSFLEFLDEDGDPEHFCGIKFYDATLRYITPNGSDIVELAIDPALIADASFFVLSGKEIKECYPDAVLEDDKEYCVIQYGDGPI